MYVENFNIGNIKYRLVITNSQHVSFEVIGGITKGGKPAVKSDKFGDSIGGFTTISDSGVGIKVIRKVIELVKNYVYSKKPDYLIINSYGDYKKYKMYLKLISKNIGSGYKIAHNDNEDDRGYILITRIRC